MEASHVVESFAKEGSMGSSAAVRHQVDHIADLREPTILLWDIKGDAPHICQIYGHFLAPRLMEAVKSSLVAKDFNFPSAYHAATGRSLEEVLEDVAGLSASSCLRVADGVRIRVESEGAVIYTPHFNGYYVNNHGVLMLELLRDAGAQLSLLVDRTPFDIDEIKDFIADLLVLGIADVVHASVPV
jgi:hypothetical protein